MTLDQLITRLIQIRDESKDPQIGKYSATFIKDSNYEFVSEIIVDSTVDYEAVILLGLTDVLRPPDELQKTLKDLHVPGCCAG